MLTTFKPVQKSKQLDKRYKKRKGFAYSYGPRTPEDLRETFNLHYKQLGDIGFFKMFLHYEFGFGESGIQIAKYTYETNSKSFITVELEPTCKDLNPENVEVNYVIYSFFEGYRERLTSVPVGEESKLLTYLYLGIRITEQKFKRYEKAEAEMHLQEKAWNRSSCLTI